MSDAKNNLLAYVAKTEGAKSVEGLIGTVSSAGEQWKAARPLSPPQGIY